MTWYLLSFDPEEIRRGAETSFRIRGRNFQRNISIDFFGPAWVKEFEYISSTEIRGTLCHDPRSADNSTRLMVCPDGINWVSSLEIPFGDSLKEVA